jgi:hypothetical protein
VTLESTATKRKKKLNVLNTDRSKLKLKAELSRILYYMAVGYDGPHLWGASARPPFPEFSPLVLKDNQSERHVRETIEKFLADPEWVTIFSKLLRELNRKL